MRYKIFGLFVTLLLIFANIASASACTVSHYQPVVPESLRK